MCSCLICLPGSSFWTFLLLKYLYIVSHNLNGVFFYLQFSWTFCILFFNRSSPSSSWDTVFLAEISKWMHTKLSYLCHVSLAFSKEHNGSTHKNNHNQMREVVFKLPSFALTDLWLIKGSDFYKETNHSLLWKFGLHYSVTAWSAVEMTVLKATYDMFLPLFFFIPNLFCFQSTTCWWMNSTNFAL